MKKLLLASALAVVLAVPSAGAAEAPAALEPAPIFVAGGTPLSNGIFFPGTAVYDGTKLQGLPYQIERGQNLSLINLDNGDIANGHQLRSIKRRPNGRPLFQSKRIDAPGETSLIVTSHVKPGVYEFVCPIHTGMYGLLEVKG